MFERAKTSGKLNVILSILEKFGMRRSAASIYKKYRLFFLPDSESIQFCGCRADFNITTLKEYNHIINFREHEGAMFKDTVGDLRHDDVFFDIGAHIGLYSCLIQKHLNEGQVVSFEPHPANHEQLKRNICINNQSVKVHNLSLGNENNETELSVHSSESGVGNPSLVDDGEGKTVTCSVRKGDHLISEGLIPEPDIMKIDVEGAELEVLSGLRETLASNSVRTIYCEVHEESTVGSSLSSFGSSADELYDFFDEIGYTVTEIEERKRDFHIRAENNRL